MKVQPHPILIVEMFVELLKKGALTTEQIIKEIAIEFEIPQSYVTDAITKAPPHKKGARK